MLLFTTKQLLDRTVNRQGITSGVYVLYDEHKQVLKVGSDASILSALGSLMLFPHSDIQYLASRNPDSHLWEFALFTLEECIIVNGLPANTTLQEAEAFYQSRYNHA